MDKLLTVVIPSYNVEKFLNQTLDSFVCDESVMKKFEVIVVDDGSKDNTAKIGKEYADKYPDTFRVISKENGGHGSTINCGIRNAVGKYFKVVDGDDWVNTADFVKLVEELEKPNPNMCLQTIMSIMTMLTAKRLLIFRSSKTVRNMTSPMLQIRFIYLCTPL